MIATNRVGTGALACAAAAQFAAATWESGFQSLLLSVFILHYLPAFHHELHMLESRDILQRIPIYGNDVRPVAAFDGTDLIRPAEAARELCPRP